MSNSFRDEPEFKTYLFKYFHNGSWWQVSMQATSMDDAQARINKLPHAQPLGELVAVLPTGTGVLARLYCWLRNALSKANAR